MISQFFLSCQLTGEYRERKKKVDSLKEELQIKINEYTKFAEQGLLSVLLESLIINRYMYRCVCTIREFYSCYCSIGGHDKQEAKAKVAVIHTIKDQLKQENEMVKQLKKDLKDIQDKIKAEKEVIISEYWKLGM